MIRLTGIPYIHKSGYMESEPAILALAALAQSTRLDVFRLLVKHEPEGLAAGDIAKALAVPQNTMSSHLAMLSRAGLVSAQRFSRSIVYRADLARFQEVMLFMLRDCCDGRPEICAPLVESLTPCCPPDQEKARSCKTSICRAAWRRKRSAPRCWSRPWSAPASWPKRLTKDVALALLGNTLADRRDPGGADHHSRADFRRAFQSGGYPGVCAEARTDAARCVALRRGADRRRHRSEPCWRMRCSRCRCSMPR